MNFMLERLHDNTRFVFSEHNRSYTCGRGKENDIICLSLFVSRRHCIFFRENENLYVTDLRSSNGIFINGEARKSLQMIKLYENDIIGIGCPNNSNNLDESVYIYKVCIIKLPILDEEEETSILSRTIVNNNTLQRISVSHVSRVLGEKYAPSSDCNRIVPEKISKVVCSNEHDSGVNSSKESNFNLSRDNKSPHNSINNLVEPKYDVIDISAEDDIEIVHASLAKEVKEDTMGCNLESTKCLNSNNKSNFEKINISGIENNNGKDISKNHVRKISESTDEQDVEQAIKYEDELQITDDDEEAHIAAIERDTTRDKSPIKLKKTRHEPKMRFSLIDVVDLSDDEEGVFPYSQLFDIKYEDNAENRTEIKQECVNDDDLNIEKIGLLNVDDEIIILTDCEDEDNKTGPWLERLSRSQLLNEDIKSVSYDMVVKDEIDLGLWEDEISNIIEQNIETRVLPYTSQFPCNKEISPEQCTSIDVKTKNKKDDYNINLPTTEADAMDVNEVGLSNKSSSKDIDNKGKQKTKTKRNINLPMAEVNAMDVNEVGPSNKSSSKDIDDKDKQKTKAKQNINLPMAEMNAMDIDEVGPSNKPSSKDIDNKDKKKTKAKENINLPMAEVNAMDVNEVGLSNKPSSKDIDNKDKQKTKAKQNINLPMTEVNAMDVDEVDPSNKPSSKGIDNKGKQKTNSKQNINLPTAEVDTMDVDEVGPSNKPSLRDIDKGKKQKINAKQNIILPTAEMDAMTIDETGPSKEFGSDNNDDKTKQKTDIKQNVELNKQTIESVKQKLLAKSTTRRLIPVIEALNLPLKRRRIDHSKDRATKVHETSQSKLITEEKMSKLKEKLNDNFYDKKQKCRKKGSKSMIDNCSSIETKSPPISKDEKQKIIEKRKMKLKEIAAEEKKLSAGNNQDIKRRIAKPRAKVSLKNRGDFLIAEQEPRVSKLLPNKSVESSKLSDDQFKKRSTDKADVVKKSATSDKRTQKTNVFKDTINNTASLQQSLHLDNMSTARTIKESTLNVKATDNVKKRSSSKSSIKRSNVNSDPTAKVSELRDRSIERDSTVQKANFSPNSLKSKHVKSSMKSGTKSKKKVSFSDEIEMREYEIDQSNTLKKLTWKDAPIPTSKLTRAPMIYTEWNPKLEEFLLRIFMWNPVWLEEQRYLKCTAPIVSENELQAMRLSYDSYKHYYEVAMPLLLLEIWCTMSKDFEMIQKNMQRATMMCSTVENSITFTPIPSTNLFLTTLMVEVLVNKEDLNKRTHPIYGDLVYLEYVKNVCGKQIFHKIFAYVTNMQHMIITDFTHYNRDLRNYVKNPYSVIMYTLLTRPLEHDIPVNRVQRVRTVTYLRSNIRMVQALQYLPQSPLLKLIVNPKIEDYQLPSLNEQYTSSLVTKDNLNPKQLEAVFRVTDAVVKKAAKLCFIQGPPGTGKSKVIVNLVSQILYGERQDKKSLRILICAPSNAAIDEIVLRLLNIRSVLKQKRFNMVRIGRSESMHPLAKNISLPELARRYLMKMTKAQKATLNGNSANEDIAILQARINSLEIELESIQKDEEKKKILMNKLVETSARCELMKSGKSIDELNPKDRAKYQRISENIILTGANIIACTLSSCYNNQMESIFGGHKERISVCIVDEATQSCEAETLIPLMLGVNTLVLVGDPNQLPATILSQRAKKLGLDQSVFSRMQNIFASQSNSPIIMLETQYRMEYAISYWPNKYFYDGKLRNATECRIKFPFHSYRVLYHDFTQNDDKFSNTTEAEFVANIIYAMLMFAKWETTSATISLGVLTPYNNQRTLVLNKINEKISSVPDNIKKKINFEVNTVDGFQGQERDVIIMSCVRSNGIGFLSDKQRLCVALTRAKHSLILCGNFCTFMKDQMWKALLTDARGRGVLCHVNANATPAIIKQFIVK